MVNTINKEWGTVIELGRTEDFSVALVIIDVLAQKPLELHHLSGETISTVFGQGLLGISGVNVFELSPNDPPVVVHPDEIFQITNPGPLPLVIIVTAYPPYDSSDEYTVPDSAWQPITN